MTDSIFAFTLHTIAEVEHFLLQPGAVVYAPYGRRCNLAFLNGCVGAIGFNVRPETLAGAIRDAEHKVILATGYAGIAGQRLSTVTITERTLTVEDLAHSHEST